MHQKALAQHGIARTFVYANLSAGPGYPAAYTASAAVLFKRHHEVSLGYNYYERKGQGIPADYADYGLFGHQNHYPQESVAGVTLMYGYALYPNRFADRTRYLLRAGLLFGHQSTPYNYYQHSSWFGANYAHDTRERSTVAFILHPTIDYTPRKVFGLSAGLYAVLSSNYSGGGVSLGMLLGRVGNRKVHRKGAEPHLNSAD